MKLIDLSEVHRTNFSTDQCDACRPLTTTESMDESWAGQHLLLWAGSKDLNFIRPTQSCWFRNKDETRVSTKAQELETSIKFSIKCLSFPDTSTYVAPATHMLAEWVNSSQDHLITRDVTVTPEDT